MAIASNLILLPSLLIGLDRLSTTKDFSEPMLEIYNEEEIELEDLNLEDENEKDHAKN